MFQGDSAAAGVTEEESAVAGMDTALPEDDDDDGTNVNLVPVVNADADAAADQETLLNNVIDAATQHQQQQQAGVEVASVSQVEEDEVSAFIHVLPQHMMKEGEIATMQVHDSATGKMKRHIIRKVM